MTLRKAIMFSLKSYPEFYLSDPDNLFIEVTNKLSHVHSFAEMIGELNVLEREQLVQSQREFQILKWTLTGKGRAWITGYRGA